MEIKEKTFYLKVAQDLGSLFGTQSSEKHNHTHEHGGHDHDHNQDHEHDHAHQHESEVHGMSGHNHEVTSAAPSVTPLPKGQKENMTKITKSKERSIEVKKKSVNWSDYFGIDKRKKKSTFLAKPGSQDQDDEWFLERYYKVIFYILFLKTNLEIIIKKYSRTAKKKFLIFDNNNAKNEIKF